MDFTQKPYVYQPHPCIRYHPEHAPRRCENAAEEAALGPGWYDTPAKFPPASTGSADEPAPQLALKELPRRGRTK